MKKFLAYFSPPLFLVFLAMILWTCGGGGGGDGPQPPFSQADLEGTADVIEFSTGNDFGWARYNVSLDGSGNITLNSGTDSTGDPPFIGPLPLPIKWVVDGSGTIREYDTSSTPNVINPALYGHLASNKRFAIATDNDASFNYSLLVIRKRDSSVTFSDADIRGKSFTYHQLYGGPDNVWTYGFGSIDSSGSVTLDNAVEPSGVLPGYPLVNLTTLTVASTGIVTNPPDNDFYGWLTHDKNTLFAIIDDPVGHSMYQFIAIQFLGHTYVQADLAGTWRFNTFYGWNSRGWAKGAWTIDAAGVATYDNTTLLNELLQVPVLAPEQLILAADGIITNLASSTYHGMLSAGGDLYVRTKTTGTVSFPRYSIAIAVK